MRKKQVRKRVKTSSNESDYSESASGNFEEKRLKNVEGADNDMEETDDAKVREMTQNFRAQKVDFIVERESNTNSNPATSRDFQDWKCTECPGVTYRQKRSLSRHIFLHHPDKKQMRVNGRVVKSAIRKRRQCPHCSKMLASSYSLKKHIRACHEGPPRKQPIRKILKWKCTQCPDVIYRTIRSLSYHITRQHPEMKEMDVNGHVARPMIPDYSKRRRQCSHCFKIVANSNVLKKHIRRYHEGRQRKKTIKQIKEWKCAACPALAYRTMESLSSHISRQHPEMKEMDVNGRVVKPKILDYSKRRRQCPYCSKLLSTSTFLKRHIRWFHTLPKIKKKIRLTNVSSKCPKCDIALRANSSLHRHLRKKHTDVKEVNGKIINQCKPQINKWIADNSVQYSCSPPCTFSHENRQVYLLHLRSRHGIEELRKELQRRENSEITPQVKQEPSSDYQE